MRWIDSPVDAESVKRLAREVKVSPLVARLLVQRGLGEPAVAQAFLHPSLGQLHAPELMEGMREAVARLRRALDQHEKILIYGDYDVDGTMAVVVLLTTLRMMGGEVEAHVPHRQPTDTVAQIIAGVPDLDLYEVRGPVWFVRS